MNFSPLGDSYGSHDHRNHMALLGGGSSGDIIIHWCNTTATATAHANGSCNLSLGLWRCGFLVHGFPEDPSPFLSLLCKTQRTPLLHPSTHQFKQIKKQNKFKFFNKKKSQTFSSSSSWSYSSLLLPPLLSVSLVGDLKALFTAINHNLAAFTGALLNRTPQNKKQEYNFNDVLTENMY